MSLLVKVLTNMEKDVDLNDLRDEAQRYTFATGLQTSLSNSLTDEYRGQIDYIKDQSNIDLGVDSDELIIGAEQPEKIRKIVESWNRRNADLCIKRIKLMEDAAAAEGFQTISDYLSSKITAEGKIGNLPYPATLYQLRKAMDAADDVFTYDSSSYLAYFYYGDAEEYSCRGVTLDEAAKEYVLLHPEKFVMIEVLYD